MFKSIISPLFALSLLAGCDPSQPSHLPNPLLLPGQAIGTAAGNAVYNARRGKVEVYVKSNFPALVQEMKAGGGPHLDQAMTLAGVAAATRPILLLRLKSDIGIYENSPDALVVALMVHGN